MMIAVSFLPEARPVSDENLAFGYISWMRVLGHGVATKTLVTRKGCSRTDGLGRSWEDDPGVGEWWRDDHAFFRAARVARGADR